MPLKWAAVATLMAVLLLSVISGRAFADDVIDVPFEATDIDLAPHVKFIDTDQRSSEIELPALSGQAAQTMTLEAKGDGPAFRWATIHLRNLGYLPTDLVLAIPYQGFVGSGLIWPKPEGTRISRVAVSRGATPSIVNDIGADSLAIRMEPSSTVTIAWQLVGEDTGSATLWQRAAFDARTNSLAFFRGVVLGIALLMTFVMFALFAVRSSYVFPSAAIFAAASVGFMALEVGYLPLINSVLPAPLQINGEVRVLVEGLMLTGLILCLVTFLELRRRQPVLGNALLGVAGLSLGFQLFGWFEPARATAAIRIAFAIIAIGGFSLVFSLWRQGAARAQASLLAWSVLFSWTLIAAASLFSSGGEFFLKPLLVAGLTLVLLTMAFTLAQFAFSDGVLSKRFFEEAGRRALALAASDQFIWDWQPDSQELYVGEEFERAIGLRPGFLAENGIDGLLELIHPMDRRAYLSAVESAQKRGRGGFAQAFRIQTSENIYRWFELRGKVVGSEDRRRVRCIGTLTDITDRKISEDRLLADAVYDRVTALPNRALLVDRLDRAISRIDSGDLSELHLIMIDIDRFKPLNDGLGHEAGDHLLSVVGRRIVSISGPNDTVARMPGDQFAVVFIGSSPPRDIGAFAEQLRHVISRPIPMQPRDVSLTASFGVAAYRDRGQRAGHLIRDASIALFEAKRQGKGAIEMFRSSMRDERSEIIALEQDLARAVDRGEIEVFYQPIARLSDMDLAGFEALIRWRHPAHGLLVPESFLAIAEQSGVIRDLGHHVLTEAARQLGIWQRAFRPVQPIFVSVNLSSTELIRADLFESVRNIIMREGIARHTLKIEVTESVVMSNPELSVRVLERLKELGIGLACDDFGTGYSSLSTLRRLPFDTLKIDRSFIETEPGDERSGVILASIAGLARELGMRIIAEGISTQLHVDLLEALGCELGQGFFIGRPMPARMVTEVLASMPYGAKMGKNVIVALWERARREPGLIERDLDEDIVLRPAPPHHPGSVPAQRPPPPPVPQRETPSAASLQFAPSVPGAAPRADPVIREASGEYLGGDAQEAPAPKRRLVTDPAPFAPRRPAPPVELRPDEVRPSAEETHEPARPNGAPPRKAVRKSAKKKSRKPPEEATQPPSPELSNGAGVPEPADSESVVTAPEPSIPVASPKSRRRAARKKGAVQA